MEDNASVDTIMCTYIRCNLVECLC